MIASQMWILCGCIQFRFELWTGKRVEVGSWLSESSQMNMSHPTSVSHISTLSEQNLVVQYSTSVQITNLSSIPMIPFCIIVYEIQRS